MIELMAFTSVKRSSCVAVFEGLRTDNEGPYVSDHGEQQRPDSATLWSWDIGIVEL